MEVILGIVALIAGVSLYDYFTARRWQQVTSVQRNEIVFENRNQQYGAYTLRKNYDKNMVIIMASVAVGIGLAFGTFWYIKNMPEEVVEPPKIDQQTFAIPAPPEEEVPPPPKEELPPPEERTVAFLPPVVVDIPVEDEIPPQEEMEDTKADTKTNETDNVSWEAPVVGEEKKPEVVEKKEEEVLTFVDEEAQFNGNMNEYIVKKLVYPQTAIEMGLSGKCYLKFIVNADGSVTNVSVVRGVPDCPECDKEAVRVIKSMPNWKPGKMNGKAVRTWLQIPINFTLQ
ncbi:MAG: TonB family protein [Crocinitomicaceae bacterium]|jgi:protein TonB|nr:TonB family protein [Crocinitomicaceae bacterium]